MPSFRDWLWNSNAQNASAVPLYQISKFNVEFKNASSTFDSVYDQKEQCRVCDFVRMNPLMFLGSHVSKDQQKFIDNVKRIFGVILVTHSGG